MPIHAEVQHATVIQLAPPLDEVGAAAVLRTLECMPNETRVILDFHRVEPLADVVVARVVRAMRHSRTGPLTTVGLTLHHQRLLRQLGLSTEEASADPSDLSALN